MYEQIYNDLLQDINSRKYKENDLLPSEKELGAKYGVSRITTSKAMNKLAKEGLITRIQGKGSFVSQNVETQIKLNQTSDAASSTNMIGVIIDYFDYDFGSDLLKSIERECKQQNLDIFFRCTYGSIKEENEAIQKSLSYGIKGLILLPVQGEKFNDIVIKMALDKFPVVLVDRTMRGVGIPCVKTDNYSATWEMTEQLIRAGHKKICFVTHESEDTSTVQERCNAFRSCMIEHPECRGTIARLSSYHMIPEKALNKQFDFDLSAVKKIIMREIDCSVFFTLEYKMGIMFQKACEDLGLNKKICTFDGSYEIFDDRWNFSHIQQDEYKMGCTAVQTLLSIINGKQPSNDIHIPYQIIK